MSSGPVDLYAPNPRAWLRLLSRLYGGLAVLRLALHRRGWLKSKPLPARVISVGNLTVGGTGKTPTVIMIAGSLFERGRRVAVLSRGYRGSSREPVNVVSDGREIFLGPSQAGDEAYLMAEALPGVPVLTGRDRWLAGRRAVDDFGAEVLVLDDGFQHLGLKRDVNLLLLDGRNPWGNGWMLPAGALREPRSEAARATAFLLTRAEGGAVEASAELARDFPGRPVFTGRHRPVRVVRSGDGREEAPGFLRGRRVVAFCGLARPDSFLRTLTELGAETALFIRRPDHHHPTSDDLRLIEGKARELGAEVVTTAKDAVKLRGRLDFWVLEVEMEILTGADDFSAMLEAWTAGE